MYNPGVACINADYSFGSTLKSIDDKVKHLLQIRIRKSLIVAKLLLIHNDRTFINRYIKIKVFNQWRSQFGDITFWFRSIALASSQMLIFVFSIYATATV
ncbi:hypothetical protein NQ317_005519 [Molorchus minor]|uniref:Uncharacterized protein n=1 Tax=Molorchus minor TaxID=1323400 RepID=A0ABQ9J235_9CUCU|nr:hypothetical protein NQ317_005519 [Molorchus minor]